MSRTSYTLTLSLIWTLVICLKQSHADPLPGPASPLQKIEYAPYLPLVMNMSTTLDVPIKVYFDKNLIQSQRTFDVVSLNFRTRTLSPQFSVLSVDSKSARVSFSLNEILKSSLFVETSIRLHANYIGRALVQPVSIEYKNSKSQITSLIALPKDSHSLPVRIVQHEGIWGVIFVVSVSILMIISYINLGAQLDEDNMKQIIKKPKTLVVGLLLSVFTMPLISWLVGLWLLRDQLLYRVGSFIFACCPVASASTLWVVMLESDKELSVGLLVVTTIIALVSMPSLLYILNVNIHSDATHEFHQIKVPYARLIQTLFVLLVALVVGWRLIARNKRMQELSRRVFRPLTFSVLLFIIIFSSILYWHIYKMFDLRITVASFVIALLTYLVSGLLGQLIDRDMDRAITIAISSAYKNSGIAFAVLLVAFESPDVFIAYVPCLTQIVITSSSLYLIHAMISIVRCFNRRGQPDTIQATADDSTEQGAQTISKTIGLPVESKNNENNDEFIALNVSDIKPKTSTSDHEAGDATATAPSSG